MKIECEHWSSCGVKGGGCCAISKFGDKPSYSVCIDACKLNAEPEPVADECSGCNSKGLKRLIQGGAKLLKSELGIDAASDDTIKDRKAKCLNCNYYDFGVCTTCGCFCAAKVKLKSEQCPKGKW
jgi:hypothetical protein